MTTKIEIICTSSYKELQDKTNSFLQSLDNINIVKIEIVPDPVSCICVVTWRV